MNQLLKLVLKLIMKHIGDETAEWMTKIAVYAQQIIINTSEELLKDPILPLAEKLRKKVEAMYAKEESLKGYLKAAADDASQVIVLYDVIKLVGYYIDSIQNYLKKHILDIS